MNPRLLSQIASYDVASIVRQALDPRSGAGTTDRRTGAGGSGAGAYWATYSRDASATSSLRSSRSDLTVPLLDAVFPPSEVPPAPAVLDAMETHPSSSNGTGRGRGWQILPATS